MAIVAKQLGIYEKYSKESSFLFVRFGERSNNHKESNGSGKVRKLCYTIYCNHGSGGGRKEGAKAIRLADMASIVDADIYITFSYSFTFYNETELSQSRYTK